MKWINIRKKKPEHGQHCLICAGSTVTAAKADAKSFRDGVIWWDGCGFSGYEWQYDFPNEQVTHWMPLPPPYSFQMGSL